MCCAHEPTLHKTCKDDDMQTQPNKIITTAGNGLKDHELGMCQPAKRKAMFAWEK